MSADSVIALVVAILAVVGTVRWATAEIARLEARIELLEEQIDATLGVIASDLPDQ